MKKLILIPFLFIATLAFASAPTRQFNYVSHNVIDPSQNNTNENTLYSYLQNGVDTYSSGSITDIAINSLANIAYSKLNLLNSIKNSDISSSAAIVASKLDLTSPGPIGSVSQSTGSFTDLAISGTLRLGTNNQGDIFFDNGNSVVRLTPGTNGQFLQTQGSSANPLWANGLHARIFTSSGTFVAPATGTVFLTGSAGGGGGGGVHFVSGGGGGGGGAYIINYPYSVIGGNSYTVTINSGGAGGIAGASGATGGSVVFDTLTLNGGSAGNSGSSGGAQNGGAGGVGVSINASTSVSTVGVSGGGQLVNTGGTGGKANATTQGGGGAGNIFGVGGSGGLDANNGNNATGFGSAGGGACASTSSDRNGGNGTNGFLAVIY